MKEEDRDFDRHSSRSGRGMLELLIPASGECCLVFSDRDGDRERGHGREHRERDRRDRRPSDRDHRDRSRERKRPRRDE